MNCMKNNICENLLHKIQLHTIILHGCISEYLKKSVENFLAHKGQSSKKQRVKAKCQRELSIVDSFY